MELHADGRKQGRVDYEERLRSRGRSEVRDGWTRRHVRARSGHWAGAPIGMPRRFVSANVRLTLLRAVWDRSLIGECPAAGTASNLDRANANGGRALAGEVEGEDEVVAGQRNWYGVAPDRSAGRVGLGELAGDCGGRNAAGLGTPGVELDLELAAPGAVPMLREEGGRIGVGEPTMESGMFGSQDEEEKLSRCTAAPKMCVRVVRADACRTASISSANVFVQ